MKTKSTLVPVEVISSVEFQSILRFPLGEYKKAIGSEFQNEAGTLIREASSRYDLKKNLATNVVIVGARSVPLVTARHVFIASLVAENVFVKSPTPDETFLIKEMIKYHCLEGRVHVFEFESDSTPLEWEMIVDEAESIVVYGSSEAIRTYRDLARTGTKLFELGPRFSLGYVDLDNETNLSLLAEEVGTDFLSYYGQGCYSPRFYFFTGQSREKYEEFIDELEEFYSLNSSLDEFWALLGLEDKMKAIRAVSLAHAQGRQFLREVEINEWHSHEDRFGLACVAFGERVELYDFLYASRGLVSTLASHRTSGGDFPFTESELRELRVPRTCQPGEMQFPLPYRNHDGMDQINQLMFHREFN